MQREQIRERVRARPSDYGEDARRYEDYTPAGASRVGQPYRVLKLHTRAANEVTGASDIGERIRMLGVVDEAEVLRAIRNNGLVDRHYKAGDLLVEPSGPSTWTVRLAGTGRWIYELQKVEEA